MDSCVSNFKQLKAGCGLDALHRSLVFYRDREGQVQCLDRPSFQHGLRFEKSWQATAFRVAVG